MNEVVAGMRGGACRTMSLTNHSRLTLTNDKDQYLHAGYPDGRDDVGLVDKEGGFRILEGDSPSGSGSSTECREVLIMEAVQKLRAFMAPSTWNQSTPSHQMRHDHTASDPNSGTTTHLLTSAST